MLEIHEHENGYVINRTALEECPAGRSPGPGMMAAVAPTERYVAESPKRAGEIVNDLLSWKEIRKHKNDRV